jgi:hypothetical protein
MKSPCGLAGLVRLVVVGFPSNPPIKLLRGLLVELLLDGLLLGFVKGAVMPAHSPTVLASVCALANATPVGSATSNTPALKIHPTTL